MKRKLHLRNLLIILGVVAVLTIGAHFLHGYQVRRNADVFLEEARKAEERGEFDLAAGHLKRYLEYRPNDDQARGKYGFVLEQLAKAARTTKARRGLAQEAFRVYDDVLRGGAGDDDMRRRIVDLAIYLRQYSDASSYLEMLVEKAPADALLKLKLGQCREANSEYDVAAAWYRKALETDEKLIEAYLQLAYLERRHRANSKRADQLIEEMITRNSESHRAYLGRYRYLKDFGVQKAWQDALRAYRMAPKEADVVLARAESVLDDPDFAGISGYHEARRCLDQGVKDNPQDLRLHMALVRLDLRTGNYEQAGPSLRQAQKLVAQQDFELLWELAEGFIEIGDLTVASELAEHLRKMGRVPAAVLFLDGAILLKKEDWLGASKMLKEACGQLPELSPIKKKAHFALAQCYEKLGSPDQQLAECREALKLDPGFVPARMNEAAALQALGRHDEALEDLRIASTKSPRASLAYARLLLLQNLRLPKPQRKWEDVERVVSEVEQLSPSAPEPLVLRAEILAGQNLLADARKLLEQAVAKHGKEVILRTALADIALRERKGHEAKAILETARKELGDSVDLRLAEARVWTSQFNLGARDALKELEKDLDKLPDRDRLLIGLAEAYTRINAIEDAKGLWTDLAKRRPTDLRTRLLLLDLALQANDEDGIQQLIKELKRIEGDVEGTLWRYGEAVRLVRLAKRQNDLTMLKPARTLLDEAGRRRPGWSRVPLLRAQIDEMEERLEDAIQHYWQAIVTLGDAEPRASRRAIQLLYERQRYAEADKVFQQLILRTPFSSDLTRLGVDLALRSQRLDQAVDLAKQAVKADSTDYKDHLWLGQVLWAAERFDEAEASLRRALRLGEQAPETWIVLVQFLARTNQIAKAEALILEAKEKLPADQADLALGQCYEAIAQTGEADAHYRAALLRNPDDVLTLQTAANFYLRNRYFQKAEPHLRKLTDPRLKAAAETVAWAKMNLTIGMATEGRSLDLQEALVLIHKHLHAGGERARKLRAEAVTLASQPGARSEAIRLLEEMRTAEPLTAPDQFLLAQLYATVQDGKKFQETMVALLDSKDGKQARYIAPYIRALLQRKLPEEAGRWVPQLEAIDPSSFQTIELKARVFFAQERKTEVPTLIKNYAESPTAEVASAAALLDELNFPSPAEELYKLYVARSRQPRSALVYAQFLSRRNRLNEALEICERSWQDCPADAVAAVSAYVVRTGQADEEQTKKVERLMKIALDKRPHNSIVLLSLADLHDWQRRYGDMESICRTVLQRDPDNVQALNNLAWLISVKFGKHDEALQHINRAIKAAGPAPALLDTRGDIYLGKNELDLALQDFEEVVVQTPTPTRYYHLARAKFLAKKPDEAQAAFKKAKELGLTANTLHPLEREKYQQLLKDLAPNG